MAFDRLIEQLHDWAATHDVVRAVCIVGSHARGDAHGDSDVDVILLCTDPHELLDDSHWRSEFGEIVSTDIEDWGAMRSIRTHYGDGLEIEFGIASTAWATLPLPAGTREVIARGMQAVYDPDGLLAGVAGAGG